MWTYHRELLARPVPRYTSYPTAAEFGDGATHFDMESALDRVEADESISLYLHIPFCHEICWYCGCNTAAANRAARLTAYLGRLHAEMALIARRLAGRGRVTRIAFGGGSPNAIAPAAFEQLVEAVRDSFRCNDAVVSVELDPRGFESGWAAALARAGVSRVSLGVQTFDPAVQAAIGRVQPEPVIRRTTALLRDVGIQSINFDLMYGLPGQSSESLVATLNTAIEMAPERMAVFGYAHVPHLVTRQRRIASASLPDAETRFRQAEAAHAMATRAGYRAIGFDHFALPGDALAEAAARGSLRRNFQGFTDDPADVLIGLGASAISAFPGWLLQNHKNTGRYHLAIATERFATARGLARSVEDRVRGRAIEMLLTRGTADLTDVQLFGCLRGRLLRFEQRGLVTWQGARLTMAPDALPYTRAIAATLDAYRDTTAARFSSAI